MTNNDKAIDALTQKQSEIPERIYAETKGTSRIWRPWYEQADVPTGDCTEYVRAQPSETPQSSADALTELKAAVEGMRIGEDSQISYGARKIYNAALSDVKKLIDEMIRRG